MTVTWPLLHYELDDYTEPWSAEPAPVVLFHHGLAGNGELFRAWVPFLADRFRVLRIDARGQGRTPKPGGYEWSADYFVQDVVDLLDHLEIERVHWAGSSGGGIIGQHAAITAPGRIASLTLIATTPRFRSPTENLDDWLAPLMRGDAREFFLQDVERRFGTGNPERTDWIVNEILRTPTKTIEDLHRWVVGVDLVPDLPKIQCPALIITGEHDTLTDLSDASLMEQHIPDARQHVIEGYPHNVGYTHPHLVAPILRQFLDEVTGADRREST
ncbi:MAG: alpha/beta hydrolase [Thermomicrobiales bacterium]